jgi:D-amino-acid dehydrogenase
MHIAVIGAGVTGLLTAWYLRQDGQDVTVLDADLGPGRGASYANGAQLSYSYVAPLAGPGVLPKVPPWLLKRDAPLRLRPSTDWRQWRWLAEFVAACNARQSEQTTRRLLKLAFYSRDLMHDFVRSAPGGSLDFGHAANGKLVVFSDAKSFASARRLVGFQGALGCVQTVLDAQACRALEPTLADSRSALARRIVGGVHTPSEEVGDCHSFCVGLARLLVASGVRFQYRFSVRAFRRHNGRLTAAVAEAGEVAADAFVLASGTGSARLAAGLGIYLPIYPLKGYSVTLTAGASIPSISITDFARKVVYAPLAAKPGTAGRQLRAAGLADLVGDRPRIDPVRLDVLLREARLAFPHASEGPPQEDDVRPWAGLRPATPRGTPILGRCAVPNLYLNTGHGALGWTLAHGSARVVSDIIGGRRPRIALDGFEP